MTSPEQRGYTSIFRLDGRKVVVVGGGSGLSRASSIALAQFGAIVVVADVNPAGVEDTLGMLTAQGLKAEGDPEVVHGLGVGQAGDVFQTDLGSALATAVELARQAGRLQVRERATLTVHGWKAHANDLVSDVDLASERLIADGLRAEFPTDGLIAEEGSSSAGTSGRRWIVDPLDGTRNYVTGAGPWSVCIALQDGSDTVVAVVHDPGAQETFTAVRGAGAELNGEPLRASDCARLAEAIVGLSFNPSVQAKRDMAQILPALLPVVGDIRRVPAALNLVYLAAGRFDAGLLLHTKLWDIAAGLLVAAEAGVILSGLDGTPTPELTLAAAPVLWREFSEAAAVAVPRPV